MVQWMLDNGPGDSNIGGDAQDAEELNADKVIVGELRVRIRCGYEY